MTARLALVALLASFATACSTCGSDDAEPTIDRPEREASGAAAADEAAEPEPPEPAGPTAADIVHDTPPTAADFAVPFVEGDWAMVRGGTHRSGLRDVPAIETPRVAWSIEVGIQGYANTPIVTQDAVFVSSQGVTHNSADDKDGLYRLNIETGAIEWHAPTPTDANGITLVDGLLITGTDRGQLFAFDPATGEQRWVAEVKCGVFQAPEARDGYVYLLRSEGTIRVRVSDGTVEGEIDSCRRSERGVVSFPGDRMIQMRDRRPMQAWELDGRLQWEAERPLDNHPGYGRWTYPQQTASMLIETVHRWPWVSESGTAYRPVAQARWADNGQLAWQIDVNDPAYAYPFPGTETAFLRAQPWVANGRVFWTPTNANTLVAYDVVTGERLAAHEFDDCRCRQFPSIVGTPTMGYLARHDGVVYAFRPDTLEVAWQLSLGLHGTAGTSDSHSDVTGACSEFPKNGTALFSTPAIAEDGRLYVGSGDGWIYAIDNASR